MTKLALLAIRIWQGLFSPDHAKGLSGLGQCRFYPSCSQYAAEALRQYGLWRGFVFLLFRVLRCSALSGGGYDPVKKSA